MSKVFENLMNFDSFLNEAKKEKITKEDIYNMSKSELEDNYGKLEVTGKLHGKEGKFHHFKKSMFDVVCTFTYSEKTKGGLGRSSKGIKVKSDSVEFN